MIYVLAVLIPPLALLLQGKIFQALFNAVFWVVGLVFLLFFGWILWGLTVLHAVIVINGARADARTQKIVDAINTKES
ncbi:YqaE/Pmp3 family membrane protein [Paremcibacter congregatus]|uniref:YqaE/Pmp3 family membrane protein n=1 Tax=Paremcibacter congregatus TaxID=2043170 RepID=UPI0015E4404A|nr:YqaE/Pmp3 family membrane protein [Paremcibacter congregatus]|tara:strand:+ start:31135 stop:31368 length:234 start_codon:yes stop_codon:yes gene_type:complete